MDHLGLLRRADTSVRTCQDATIELPEDITYKAALPGMPQVAVLFGDPTKPGVYVVRVKVPSGLKLMPHWHPDEVRTVVVLSGTFLHGYGEQWDEPETQSPSPRHVLL